MQCGAAQHVSFKEFPHNMQRTEVDLVGDNLQRVGRLDAKLRALEAWPSAAPQFTPVAPCLHPIGRSPHTHAMRRAHTTALAP